MAVEDFVESEVAVAVAATAAILSPPVRSVLRRGAVYGLAGALMVGSALESFGLGVARGAREAAESAGQSVAGAVDQMTGAPEEA